MSLADRTPIRSLQQQQSFTAGDLDPQYFFHNVIAPARRERVPLCKSYFRSLQL